MKKLLLLVFSVIFFVSSSNGQSTTLFEDDFDNQSYETSFPPPGWQLIDQDEDTNNWYWDFYATDNDGYLLSRSYLSPDPLTPDNWIITPGISLMSVPAQENVYVKFTVCPTATTAQYRTEHYGVFISTTGTSPADFTMVYEETLLETMTNWEWLDRKIDLTSYTGQTIYIAFRHWNSTDKDRIAINDLKVYSELSAGIDDVHLGIVNIFPNPAGQFFRINGVRSAEVEIMNLMGARVLTQHYDSSGKPVDISQLIPGMYLVRIKSERIDKTQKLIINR